MQPRNDINRTSVYNNVHNPVDLKDNTILKQNVRTGSTKESTFVESWHSVLPSTKILPQCDREDPRTKGLR